MSERRGYTMGRLLAALDHLGVVPDVEGLYVLASIDPRHLTGPLNRATATGEAARDYLAPLMGALTADTNPFSAVLTEEEQADFGLGYYHQRADIRDGRAPAYDDEMSVAEAAALLGVQRETVYQAIARGALAAREAAGRKVVRRSDVERYAATRKPAPARPAAEVQ
jgi:excisionase family DNA binding protein